MATIDSKDFVDNIIRNNGYYNGDDDNEYGDNPRCVKVVEYTNAFGSTTWGVVFDNELDKDRYNRATEFVRNPRTIWEYNSEP